MSYCTIEDADDYFYDSSFSGAWDNATSEEKRKSLITASRLIDALPLDEERMELSETTSSDFEIACCEIALLIVDGTDPEKEFELLSVTSQKYANSAVSYSRDDYPEHILYHIPSSLAWRYLKAYLSSSGEVGLHRVS